MELRSEDITSEVCRRCAACCKSVMNVEGDLRNLEFNEKIYGSRLEVVWRGLCACGCGSVKYRGQITEACPALDSSDGTYTCRDYAGRPSLCREFNCVTWAMVNGHKDTALTRRAAESVFATRMAAAQRA